MSGVPLRPELTILSIYKGSVQQYAVDYYVLNNILYWTGTPLEGQLGAGDILRISYPVYALRDADITFTYNIRSVADAHVMDLSRSRVFDRDHVFPARCYDGYADEIDIQWNEYINFLSDYSTGIKFTYFNKTTFQIEEHVFTGPVFESYDASEDEISSSESFPEALVKIRNPLNPVNPLNLLTNYAFIDEPAIRIRKKTLRELLPNRTFRTLKITEALPV
jgi:hypothetical protein